MGTFYMQSTYITLLIIVTYEVSWGFTLTGLLIILQTCWQTINSADMPMVKFYFLCLLTSVCRGGGGRFFVGGRHKYLAKTWRWNAGSSQIWTKAQPFISKIQRKWHVFIIKHITNHLKERIISWHHTWQKRVVYTISLLVTMPVFQYVIMICYNWLPIDHNDLSSLIVGKS